MGAASATGDDYLQVIELMHRYAFAIDAADADEIASLFTPDGVWISPFTGTTRGREAIRALIVEKHERNARRVDEFRRHFITNPLVDIVDDRGEIRASVLETRLHGTTIDVVYTGHYRNSVVKVDGAWRFAIRECIQDVAGGALVDPRPV